MLQIGRTVKYLSHDNTIKKVMVNRNFIDENKTMCFSFINDKGKEVLVDYTQLLDEYKEE